VDIYDLLLVWKVDNMKDYEYHQKSRASRKTSEISMHLATKLCSNMINAEFPIWQLLAAFLVTLMYPLSPHLVPH